MVDEKKQAYCDYCGEQDDIELLHEFRDLLLCNECLEDAVIEAFTKPNVER
jgi:hypothetical protein